MPQFNRPYLVVNTFPDASMVTLDIPNAPNLFPHLPHQTIHAKWQCQISLMHIGMSQTDPCGWSPGIQSGENCWPQKDRHQEHQVSCTLGRLWPWRWLMDCQLQLGGEWSPQTLSQGQHLTLNTLSICFACSSYSSFLPLFLFPFDFYFSYSLVTIFFLHVSDISFSFLRQHNFSCNMCWRFTFHFCYFFSSLFQVHVFYDNFSYMLHPCMCMHFSMLLPCFIHEALLYIN